MGFILHDICSLCIKRNSIPVYRFLTKRKLAKKIDDLKEQFMDLDTFKCSGMMISFMSSVENCEKYIHNIKFGESYIDVYLPNGESAIFYARSNRYEVTKQDISYTIYRNTEIPKKIKDDWKDMENAIKNIFIDCVFCISNLLSEDKYNDNQ